MDPRGEGQQVKPVRLTDPELIVTDEELKQHLRIDEDMWSAQSIIVRMFAMTAQEEAETTCRRAIAAADYELTANGPLIEIPNPPVISVEGHMTERKGGHTLVRTGEGEQTITYRAGYERVPLPIKVWVLLRTATLYENRSADAEKVVVPHTFASELLVPYISHLILE